MSHSKYIITSLLFLFLLLSGCQDSKPKSAKTVHARKELVIYCENAMLMPVLDLKRGFEEMYKCSVMVHSDCSQNLMSFIKLSQKGDIYIPSSSASFIEFKTKTNVTLTDSTLIGYNKLVFMVNKGNPTHFDGRLSSLTKTKLPLVLANPETCSLGYETRKAIKSKSYYDALLPNIISLTIDSRGLVKSLKNQHADVVINWKSEFFVNRNSEEIDIVDGFTEFKEDIPVYAATLSCSTESDLAKEFLVYSDSKQGQLALRKYGFSKREAIIF